MKRREVRELVEVWQERLGLQHWRLTVEFRALAEARAEANRDHQYDQAEIVFDVGVIRVDTDDQIEALIVHELLHLLARDLEQFIAQLGHVTHPDVHGVLERQFEHELEGVIDRAAWVMIALARSNLS